MSENDDQSEITEDTETIEERREDGDQEQQTTSSNYDQLNPEHISYNTNDLKVLDFNSADDVRQTIKAVLAAKNTITSVEVKTEMITSPQITLPKGNGDMKHNRLNEKCDRSRKKRVTSRKTKLIEVEVLERAQNYQDSPMEGRKPHLGRKRRGRPPNAGPSKKIKKTTITEMYNGKLSNFAYFEKYGSESDDSEFDYFVFH